MRAMELASQRLRADDRERPLLTRMAGIALARLGETKAAMRELEHSLRTARDRSAEYDIAATIDAMAAIDGADPCLLRERDEILETPEDRVASRAGPDLHGGVRAAAKRRPSQP